MEQIEKTAEQLSLQFQTLSEAIKENNIQTFQYTQDEEHVFEDQLNKYILDYQQAIEEVSRNLKDGDIIGHDIKKIQTDLLYHQDKLKQALIMKRKFLISFREKIKAVQLEQARLNLFIRDSKKLGDTTAAGRNSSAVHVTATLKRTRNVLSQEIERVSSVSKVLNDGRQYLLNSQEEYGSVQSEITQVRKQLKALRWQARQDKLWISAGIALLLSTVVYIIYGRTGFIII